MRKLDLTPEQRREREREQSRARNRRYRERHHRAIRKKRTSEPWLQYRRDYYARNAERIRAQIAAALDPAKKRILDARYRKRMGEALRAKKRQDYQRNKARYAAAFRRAYERNKDAAVARVREWRLANPEAVFAQYAKRRAAKLTKGLIEKVDRLIIFNRDKGLCGICGQPVDPKAFTLDHIVPLSRGGAHIAENLQLAHRSCNCRKHARSMAELAAIA